MLRQRLALAALPRLPPAALQQLPGRPGPPLLTVQGTRLRRQRIALPHQIHASLECGQALGLRGAAPLGQLVSLIQQAAVGRGQG